MIEKYYELTFLTKDEEIENIKAFLDKHGIKDYKFTDDGEKTLAYSVQGCEKGHFYYVDEMLLNEKQVRAISSELDIADWVLRYLLASDLKRNK